MDVRDAMSPFEPRAPKAPPLSDDDLDLMNDIAAGIDKKVAALQRGRRGPLRYNLSFVIDCRERLKERLWDRPRQRRICAALEQHYCKNGWLHASIYVMDHGHLRLRVTLRAPRSGPL